MTIDFGYVLPAGPPKGKIEHWLHELDELAPMIQPYFKGLWMTDHFFWEDDPTFEAWTVLAFVAARYPQFEIGPVVLGQSYRNPALLAKMAATLQTLCQGRFVMGIGAGWKEDEYRGYGYPFPRAGIRLEQLEDTLEILQRLWKEAGPVTYQGKHYQVDHAWCEPKPKPIPPIMVGGGGEKTMMLAARFGDWWSLYDADVETYRARVAVLHRHCETIGRDPATIRKTWFGRLAVAQSEAEALALSNGRWTRQNAIVGSPQQVVETIQQLAEIGCDYFQVDVLQLIDPEMREFVFTEVLQKVTR